MKNKDEIKDGFDLICYPCDYTFKAVCRVLDDMPEVSAVIRKQVLAHIENSDLLNWHSTNSKTGKFQSVTLVVRLQNRQQLEIIYQQLASLPMVVMTL